MSRAFPCFAVATVVALVWSAAPVRAQYVPSTPLVFAGGRVVIGGDVSASVAERDEEGWFNYTDYEHDALRMIRWSVSGEWRIARRVSFLGELRAENTEHPRVYGAYLRVRPFARVPVDVQAGRIPPTFGAFSRRLYSSDNPLIGYPLAYQYLVSIRPDAIPATPDDLLRMRARGWQSSFPVGSAEALPGVSPIAAFQWDTGVQVRASGGRLEGALALTNGSLSSPRVNDNNGGKQVVARVQFRPLFGLVVGVSGSRGAWLDRGVERLVAPGQSAAHQRAVGLDAEYSWGHWIVRAEGIRTVWDMPSVATNRSALDLVATGGWIEGRYRLTPRFYLAARADHLTFSTIRGLDGTLERWEAPVTRLEAGGGWYLQRNLIARISVQRNRRDGGRVSQRTFVAGQVMFWF